MIKSVNVCDELLRCRNITIHQFLCISEIWNTTFITVCVDLSVVDIMNRFLSFFVLVRHICYQQVLILYFTTRWKCNFSLIKQKHSKAGQKDCMHSVRILLFTIRLSVRRPDWICSAHYESQRRLMFLSEETWYCSLITTVLCTTYFVKLTLLRESQYTPCTFGCCGDGGCPSDIVLRCHAMVTTVELPRRCIHCSHSKAVNHSSVFRCSHSGFNLPRWMCVGWYGTHTVGSHTQYPIGSFWYKHNYAVKERNRINCVAISC